MTAKLEPKPVIWWGVGMLLGGIVLIVFAPMAFIPLSLGGNPAGQAVLGFLNLVLGVVRQIILPLGSAFIGAGIVMVYIDRRSR